MAISKSGLQTVFLALLILPVARAMPWQNTHALAKILMNRSFMAQNPKELPRFQEGVKPEVENPDMKETGLNKEAEVTHEKQKTGLALPDGLDESTRKYQFAKPLGPASNAGAGKATAPAILPKIEVEPPADTARKNDKIADDSPTSKGDLPYSIDSLVYGHAPEAEAKILNSQISKEINDTNNQYGYPGYEEDYYYSEGDYDQITDSAGKTEVEIQINQDESVKSLDMPPKASPSEIFSLKEVEVKKEEVEKKESEVKKAEEKKYFYDIPYGLFLPPYMPSPYVMVPHYPWITIREILWNLEAAMAGLSDEEEKKTKKGYGENVDVNEEVVDLDGKKYLLKNIKTTFDSSEKKHPFVSLTSLTPVADGEEKREMKPLVPLPEEMNEEVTQEETAATR